MLPHTGLQTRIPLRRLLRPPNSAPVPWGTVQSQASPPSARAFTGNPNQLFIAQPHSRPELSYLSPPSLRRRAVPFHAYHLRRLLSTETKRYIIDQTKLATKWTAIGWAFLLLGSWAWFGWDLEQKERENPTPAEWSFLTRQALRSARADLDPRRLEVIGFIDYASAGSSFVHVLQNLENREKEGKDVGDGGDIYVPGVGALGHDFTAKSWPWRAGYYEVVMGLAKCSQECDDMVLDKTRGIVFPREVMIGPSNPDPRPVPRDGQTAPLEENCTAPFPPPESYYMRILTGTGFTSRQKLNAALAYADWLERKGLQDSAGEMYRWGVDIALGALPASVSAADLMDGNSGVLKTAAGATPNLLLASKALAGHLARNGELSSALPIFLSVLRAYREAPVSSFRPSAGSTAGYPDPPKELLSAIARPQKFPPPPPTGDDPLTRTSNHPSCEESELMLNVGEIIFATAASGKAKSTSEDEGLAWTRQAVSIAEENLRELQEKTRSSVDQEKQPAQKYCRDCLRTGVSNWEVMLERLQSRVETTKDHKGWFGRSNPAVAQTQAMLETDVERVAALKQALSARPAVSS